jgi:hypothetical protein
VIKDYTVGKTIFPLPVKIYGDSCSLGIAKYEYDNQIALSPTNVNGEGIKFKNYVCTKKYCIGF